MPRGGQDLRKRRLEVIFKLKFLLPDIAPRLLDRLLAIWKSHVLGFRLCAFLAVKTSLKHHYTASGTGEKKVVEDRGVGFAVVR